MFRICRQVGSFLTKASIPAVIFFLLARPVLGQVSFGEGAVRYWVSGSYHIAEVDLSNPGVVLRATRYGERNRTTASFAQLMNADVAINGDYFFSSNYQTRGLAIGEAERWPNSNDRFDHSFLACTATKSCLIDPGNHTAAVNPGWRLVVGGNNALLVVDGRAQSFPSFLPAQRAEYYDIKPHTAVGLSGDGKRLWMVVSSTTNYPALASLLASLGARTAIKMDGGGSSDMVVAGHSKLGTSRRVANHLGVRFDPSLVVVGGAAHPSGGYYVVYGNGRVEAHGSASYYGDASHLPLVKPIVGMAVHPSGLGYWLVAADGGVFTFGASKFYGSAGGLRLVKPIVGMAAHPNGNGYWLVASDGGVFTYGACKFFGSAGGLSLASPVVGMAARPSGNGYWLVAADGGVFTYGDAPFKGSMGGKVLNRPVTGIASALDGRGYYLVAADGGVFTFGSALYWGAGLDRAIDIALLPDGRYWLINDQGKGVLK
jgi:Phosphodiester glycosidase